MINGILYAVGGYNSGVLSSVEAYDPGTDMWTFKRSMPTPRYWLGAAAVGGTLYAVGGYTETGASAATLEAYDAATDTWSPKASMSTARAELAVAALNGIIYAVGGTDASPVATVEAYHP